MGRDFENVWDVLIEDSDEDKAKAKADLILRINVRVNSLGRGVARKLKITPGRLADLRAGKIEEFRMLELQALARRAGIKP